MSTDTPRPERVTLTAEERVALSWGVHDARSSGLPREDCTGCGPIADRLGPVIERILAAREQALREEIAGQLEWEASLEFARAERAKAVGIDGTHNRGQRLGFEVAARIARGETR